MKHKPAHRRPANPRVLGTQVFCAIAAVEGLRLTADSKKRVDTLVAGKLSPEQRRVEIMKAYMSKAGK